MYGGELETSGDPSASSVFEMKAWIRSFECDFDEVYMELLIIVSSG